MPSLLGYIRFLQFPFKFLIRHHQIVRNYIKDIFNCTPRLLNHYFHLAYQVSELTINAITVMPKHGTVTVTAYIVCIFIYIYIYKKAK
jgi:hypothetical protein